VWCAITVNDLSVANGAKVTFVEFVDFECQACRAAHWAIETLREMYDGRVTFVVRNSPLHEISEQAARPVRDSARVTETDDDNQHTLDCPHR
jgi:protein-disulfide isomerase